MFEVPFLDLNPQHAGLEQTFRALFESLLNEGQYVGGHSVSEFETAFARATKMPHCATVGNGTDAIELALRAAGIGPGHEVILPANSFVATATAIVRAGATPTFADVDRLTGLLDPDDVEQRATPSTRAVIPVHLYGQLAPVEQYLGLARDRGWTVIEDAAQAHGATRFGAHAGSLGAAATYSFYPSKNLGALGDGGAVITSDPGLDEAVRQLGNYGSVTKYHHSSIGFNSRLDALQAAVLLAKLPHLDEWNGMRREAATVYEDLLSQYEEIELPVIAEGNVPAWHLYVVQVPHRDRVLKGLRERGIECGLHYPVPIHLQVAFAHLGWRRGDLPRCEERAARILSLPLFPGISLPQQHSVVDALARVLRETGES